MNLREVNTSFVSADNVLLSGWDLSIFELIFLVILNVLKLYIFFWKQEKIQNFKIILLE